MSRIRRGILVLLTVAACVVAPTAAATAATSVDVAACAVTYKVHAYDGGFTAQVRVRNTGNIWIQGWTLAFRLPEGVEIVEIWNAELVSPSGEAATRDLGWNANVPPQGAIELGFRAVGPAQPPATDFRVNGISCSVT